MLTSNHLREIPFLLISVPRNLLTPNSLESPFTESRLVLVME